MGPRVSESSAPSASPTRAPRSAPTVPGGASAAPTVRGPRGRPAPSGGTQRTELSDRDIRRKRPPALSFLLRMSTVRRLSRVLSLMAIDFAGVALAIFAALVLKEAVHGSVRSSDAIEQTKHFLPFAYLLTALLFARSGLYAERALRPGLSRIVGSLFQVAVVAVIFALVNGLHFSSYYIFWSSLALASLLIGSARAAYERVTAIVLRAAGYRRRAVLVGRGKQIADVAHALSDAQHYPIEVVGFLSPSPLPANGLRSLGSLEHLGGVLDHERIDEVIIADPDFPQDEAVELVDQCHRRGIRVKLAPSTMEILIHRAEFVPGQSVPLFELAPPVFEGVDFALKRTFDVVGATLLLALLSPLLLAIALAVRISSRGPVLYHSMRRGIAQRPFACLKFRTMHTNAEERQADLEEFNEASGALFKIRDDPRLTPVGRLLRRFSLDELPQLVNVLRGDMSLVGPRPERPFFVEQFEKEVPRYCDRHRVPVGLTGLAQVNGLRGDTSIEDRAWFDNHYIENWSVGSDLVILARTAGAVIRQVRD